MKVFRKLGVAALVVMLAMCFCSVAYAEATPVTPTNANTGAVADGTTIVDLQTTGVSFNVSVVNKDSNADPRPGVRFFYYIGGGTDVASFTNKGTAPSVTFTSPVTDSTTPAIPDSTISDVTWSKAEVAYSNTGSTATNATVNLSISGASGTDRGIWEYPITQWGDTNLSTAGFEIEDNTLFLTLVVNRGKVTQAILHKSTASNLNGLSGTNNISDKVAGFENTYTPATVTLAKYVTGNAGSYVGDDFKFSLTIENTNSNLLFGSGFAMNATGTSIGATNGNALSSALAFDGNDIYGETYLKAISGTDIDEATEYESMAKSPNEGKVTISGIPGGTKVKLTETLVADHTAAGFTIKSYSGDTSAATAGVGASATATSDSSGTEVTATVGTPKNIAYFNDLQDISLTGVTLRYAPYLLTLGAGLVVLPLSRGWKRREEED